MKLIINFILFIFQDFLRSSKTTFKRNVRHIDILSVSTASVIYIS